VRCGNTLVSPPPLPPPPLLFVIGYESARLCYAARGLLGCILRPHVSIIYMFKKLGTAVAQWRRYCATNRKVAGSIPAGVSGFLIDIKSFRSHYCPGVDSASNIRVPGLFLGGKGGRWVRLTTHHHPVPLSRNLGTLTSWKPLGPSGPITGLLYLYMLKKLHKILNLDDPVFRLL